MDIAPALRSIAAATIATMAVAGSALATPAPAAADSASGPTGDPASSDVRVFPYGEFHEVPRLGSDPVRGSGCGLTEQIGETVPDGIWAGLTPDVGDGQVTIDLVCVYTPEAAQGIIDEGSATIIHPDPNYLVVNNSPRLRTMPAANGMHLRDAQWSDDGCLEAGYTADREHSGYQAWINVQGGQVTWIVWGCTWMGEGPEPTPQPHENLPPAYPDPNAPFGSWWPYGAFWNVPSLTDAPARGSGCGTEESLGERIPDGLWAGYLSYDPATDTFWVDIVCIYYGEYAERVLRDDEWNIVNPDPAYLIVNNQLHRRPVPNDVRMIAFSTEVGGDCLLAGAWYYGDDGGGGEAPYPDSHAWIRVHNGAITWFVYGCDTGFVPGG